MMRSTAFGRLVVPQVTKLVGLTLTSILVLVWSGVMAVGGPTSQTPGSNTPAEGSTGATSQKPDSKPAQPGGTPATVSPTQPDELTNRVNALAEQVTKMKDQVGRIVASLENLPKERKEGQAPAVADSSKSNVAAPAGAKIEKVAQNSDPSANLEKLKGDVTAIQAQLTALQKKLDQVPAGSLSAALFKPTPLAQLTKDLNYADPSNGKSGKVGSTSQAIQQEFSTISLKLKASEQSSQDLQSQLRSKTSQLPALVRERDAKYLEWYKAQNDQAEAERKGSSQEDIDEKKKKVDDLARAKGDLDRKVDDAQKQIVRLIECIKAHECDAGKLASDRTIAGLVQEFLRASGGGTGSASSE